MSATWQWKKRQSIDFDPRGSMFIRLIRLKKQIETGQMRDPITESYSPGSLWTTLKHWFWHNLWCLSRKFCICKHRQIQDGATIVSMCAKLSASFDVRNCFVTKYSSINKRFQPVFTRKRVILTFYFFEKYLWYS